MTAGACRGGVDDAHRPTGLGRAVNPELKNTLKHLAPKHQTPNKPKIEPSTPASTGGVKRCMQNLNLESYTLKPKPWHQNPQPAIGAM